MNGSRASPADCGARHALTVVPLGARWSMGAQLLWGSNLDEVCFYGTGTIQRTHLSVLRKAVIIGAGRSTADDSLKGSATMGVRSGTPLVKVWGRTASGDFGDASHPLDRAWSALKWCSGVKVFGAVATMGKNRTRGRRGLYLKGNGVVRIGVFVLILISDRIEDSLRNCYGFVSVLITPQFCFFALKSSRAWGACNGVTCLAHAGTPGWPAGSRARQGNEYGRRRP
jgi:hypothetical protein